MLKSLCASTVRGPLRKNLISFSMRTLRGGKWTNERKSEKSIEKIKKICYPIIDQNHFTKIDYFIQIAGLFISELFYM